MNKSFTFGCGQGATKAMIHCIENGTLNRDECCVVNSTVKDIPENYQRDAIIMSPDQEAGCGKERNYAKSLMLAYLKQNPNAIEARIPQSAKYVNILTTTEGASGSGASVILARWIATRIQLPVIITLICGFETDTRGLQNTIEYFKDLEGVDYVVRTVSNKKFLEKTNNTFVAEKMANEDISTGIKVINAFDIVDSEQNIDDTDHFKLITNPGMMFATEVTFDKKLKNSNQFDQIVSDAIDYSSSLDFTPSATKVGIFMNISDDNLSVIDTNFTSLKKKLCGNTIDEFFIHRQYIADKPEFVRIIASGMNLPKDELVDIYNKYKKNLNTENSKEDDFFGAIKDMKTNVIKDNKNEIPEDKDDDFFAGFNMEELEASSPMNRGRRRASFSTGNKENTTNQTTTPQTPIQSDTYKKPNNNNKFVAKKSSSNEIPYSEDSIKGF
jgi:hypothetical protein